VNYEEALPVESELRRSPRFPFYASAEITESRTKTKFNTRTSELSRHGCYMDMMNPFPLGTAVHVQITYNHEKFDVPGRVVYSQPNMGMGVAFEALPAGQAGILEKWLAELEGKPQ
jgi:PilZ domain